MSGNKATVVVILTFVIAAALMTGARAQSCGDGEWDHQCETGPGGTKLVYDSLRQRTIAVGPPMSTSPTTYTTWAWEGSPMPTWTLVTDQGPTIGSENFQEEGPAVVYDSAHDKIVLFGGGSFWVPLNQTWLFDGISWTQVFPATVPPARSGGMMAYDNARGRSVIFGGYGPNETWEWDGTDWFQVVPATSPAGAWNFASMAYDSARGVVVLFGVPWPTTDTWEYDGTNWTQRFPVTSPSPRRYHGMTYDPTCERVILFGGQQYGSPLVGDTWAWDGNDWTQLFPRWTAGPHNRLALTYDSLRQRVVLLGSGADTWEWSEDTPTAVFKDQQTCGYCFEPGNPCITAVGCFSNPVIGCSGCTPSCTGYAEGTSFHAATYTLTNDVTIAPAGPFDGSTPLCINQTHNYRPGGGGDERGTQMAISPFEFFSPGPIVYWKVTVGSNGYVNPCPPESTSSSMIEWSLSSYGATIAVGPDGHLANPQTFYGAYSNNCTTYFTFKTRTYVPASACVADAEINALAEFYLSPTPYLNIAYDIRTSQLAATASSPSGSPPPNTVDGDAYMTYWKPGSVNQDQYILWAFNAGAQYTDALQILTGLNEGESNLMHFSLDYTTDPSPTLGSVFTPLEIVDYEGFGGGVMDNEVTVATRDVDYRVFYICVNATAIRLHVFPNGGLTPAGIRIHEVSMRTAPQPPPDVVPNVVIGPTGRGITFNAPGFATAAGSGSAIRVRMVELQNPVPPNLPQYPPPDFTAYESGTCSAPGEAGGCARWVGKPGTFLESQDNPSLGNFKAARLQCTPYYHDFAAEGVVHVAGAETVPSSTYEVRVYSASCKGSESTCTGVSAPVTMLTRRSGDIAANFNPPSTSTQPDALDVAAVVNKLKNLPGALVKAITQLQPNLPELNADVNALDIVAVVDAVKQKAYAFSGPCPCPSAVTCGVTSCTSPTICGTTYGAGSTCVKTCVTGANAGDPCINNSHCPGSTCGAGFCRDRCGRCTP